jgi:hypothetical protein
MIKTVVTRMRSQLVAECKIAPSCIHLHLPFFSIFEGTEGKSLKDGFYQKKCVTHTKGDFGMNSPYRESGGGIGWIIFLVLLYIIFNPIPGPIDDAAAVAIGGYQALKRL